MKTECSRLSEDDPLLRSSIHAQACHGGCLLAAASAVHGVETMEGAPTIPNAEARLQPYGILFVLRIDVRKRQ
ncbi:hypothetical protein U9M48_000567 [Paspalum notatum var. saurae]|uniref:Uncharacterized protein n=1 Tax=Paspalum notatum var. saurae TaxID=547442 RepID=A0AAQ3PGZ4_PASNO